MTVGAVHAVSELVAGIIPSGLLEAMERVATVSQCDIAETIYHYNDPADYWYRILTGAARKCALTADGRRQIVDFLLPGDLFGFGAHGVHRFSAEAIVAGTRVARYPRQRAECLAETDPRVARRIRETAFASISRLQQRMVILGRTSALDKVSDFLLEMVERCSCAGPVNVVALPMSRYDIADYLAMAVETVSRALTELKVRGVITFDGARRVFICDRRELERVADAGLSGVARADSSMKAGNRITISYQRGYQRGC